MAPNPKFMAMICCWDRLLPFMCSWHLTPRLKRASMFRYCNARHFVSQASYRKDDHLEFPGVIPCTFIGSLLVSTLASPIALAATLLQLPKIYSLYAVRLVLGCIILSALRFFRVQIRKNFGAQVEAFFVILTAIQFHMLFYCTGPLPNILAFGLVNLAYGYWLKQRFYAALNCLVFATVVFRCDILLLVSPLDLELLLTRSISLRKAVVSCTVTAIFSIASMLKSTALGAYLGQQGFRGLISMLDFLPYRWSSNLKFLCMELRKMGKYSVEARPVANIRIEDRYILTRNDLLIAVRTTQEKKAVERATDLQYLTALFGIHSCD